MVRGKKITLCLFFLLITRALLFSLGRFGMAVAIDGDHALIGANGEEFNTTITNNCGSAYFFYRNLGGPEFWGLLVRVTSPLPVANALAFGWSCSISGDHALVGAVGFQNDAGEALHFVRKTVGGQDDWPYSSTLKRQNPQSIEMFGGSVSLNVNGQLAAVGAYGVSTYQGEASVYQLSEDGTQYDTLYTIADPAPAANSDQMGISVHIDRTGVFSVGANKKPTYIGAAYSLQLPLPPPSPGNSQSLLWLFIPAIAVAAGLVAVGVIIIRHQRSAAQRKAGPAVDSDDLLEFSPPSDMAFIDIHSARGYKQQNAERASIKSGSSLGSNATASSTTSSSSRKLSNSSRSRNSGATKKSSTPSSR